jgi:copper homeostasis protein CutC
LKDGVGTPPCFWVCPRTASDSPLSISPFMYTHVCGRQVDRAGGRLGVLAGAGVTVANAAELVAATDVCQVHASCSSSEACVSLSAQDVLERARSLGFMGGEGERRGTDGSKVRELAALVHGLGGSEGAS